MRKNSGGGTFPLEKLRIDLRIASMYPKTSTHKFSEPNQFFKFEILSFFSNSHCPKSGPNHFEATKSK
jgi:hypothetical protein